jgi:ubiquinone/menaquinone biosynthesis C-methylase UbiE
MTRGPRRPLPELLGEKLDALFASGPRGPVRVLDVACGDGVASEVLCRHLLCWQDHPATRLLLQDLNLRVLAQAWRRLRSAAPGRLFFVQGDLFGVAAASGSLDYLIALNVIHGIDYHRFAPEARRVLKPQGRLFIYNFSPELAIPRFTILLTRMQLAALQGPAGAG